MSREREFLLTLLAWAHSCGHARGCDAITYELRESQGKPAPCTCGYDDMVRAGDWLVPKEGK